MVQLYAVGDEGCGEQGLCGAIYKIPLDAYGNSSIVYPPPNTNEIVTPGNFLVSAAGYLLTQWNETIDGTPAGIGKLAKVDGSGTNAFLYGDEVMADPRSPYLSDVTGADSDGTNLYVISGATIRLQRINESSPQLFELLGGGSTSANSNGCKCDDPVSLPLGDLTESMTDMAVPGRGPALQATRHYDSAQASHSSAFGYSSAPLAVRPSKFTSPSTPGSGASVVTVVIAPVTVSILIIAFPATA